MKVLWLTGLHATAYAGAALVLRSHPSPVFFIVALVLIWISVSDCLTYEIPDIANLALAALAALWTCGGGLSDIMIFDNLVGAILWPVIFWLTARFYLQRRGVDGLGFGDVNLMVGLGLLCGFTGSIYVVLAASLSAAATLLVNSAFRTFFHPDAEGSALNAMVAFGPFLCLSGWCIWLMRL